VKVYPTRLGLAVKVTGATNAVPIVVTTSAAHELVTGDLVDISGVLGNTNANINDKAVTVVTSTTFSLAGIKGNGDYHSGGTVRCQEISARARDYAAATAAAGTIHRFAGAAQAGRFNFYVDAASDPGTTNKEVDVIVYGRVDPDSDWFQIQQINEDVGFAQVGSGRWVSTALDLPIQPELRIDIVASSGSTNTCRGWIAV